MGSSMPRSLAQRTNWATHARRLCCVYSAVFRTRIHAMNSSMRLPMRFRGTGCGLMVLFRAITGPRWLRVRRDFLLAALVVIFSRFGPISPFRRASTGDSSPAPPPDTPRTWARLDPDFSPSTPDFFAS